MAAAECGGSDPVKNVFAPAALATIVAASCSEPGGAPTLVASYKPVIDFDQVSFSWTHPTGAADGGYALEGRALPEPFRVLRQVGATTLSLPYAFAADTPEATDFEFRLRALPDEDGSRTSNVVSIRRAVRAPLLTCTKQLFGCVPVDGRFELAWSNRSRIADAFVVERRIATFTRFVPDADWTAVGAPVPATTTSDGDLARWSDGALFEYRVVATKGSDRSIASNVVSTQRAPFAAPVSVTATPRIGGGVDVTFQNASRTANWIRVRVRQVRPGTSSWFQVAALPAPPRFVTTSVRSDFGREAVFEYGVRATLDDFKDFPFDSETSVSVTLPPKDFSATFVEVPSGTAAVRTSVGAFATAGGLQPSAAGSYLVAPGGPNAAVQTLPAGTSLSRPGVVLDLAGQPHAVYAVPITATPTSTAIVHTWHDGQSWRTEEIARRDVISRVRFDVGIDGTLHASWDSPASLETAKLVNGGWTIDDVGAALGADFQPGWANHFLAGDETGAAHIVAFAAADRALHVFRDPTGWHAESIAADPSVLPFPTGEDGVRLVARRRGRDFEYHLGFAYQPVGKDAVYFFQRTTSFGWVPRDLTFGSTRRNRIRIEAGRNADGTRVVVAGEWDDGAGTFWTVNPTGEVFQKAWFDPGSRHAVGIRADGKAWILAGLQDAAPDSIVRAYLLEEL